MGDVRNCKRCGKIFSYGFGPQICSDCKDKDEADFKRIKEYLYDNPGASLSEVASILDIPVEKIKRFLKDGRLEIVGDEPNFVLDCERCGKSIRTGRYCDECERDVSKNISSMSKQLGSNIQQQSQAQKSEGMRFLNKENKK